MINNLSNRKTSPWNEVVDDYRNRWVELNKPFFDAALPLLPELPENARVHLPGVGPGTELPWLRKRFASAHFLGTDIAPKMVAKGAQIIKDKNVDWFAASADQIPFSTLDASFSFFMIHLIRRPLNSVQAQWSSLRSSGSFAALYFPPQPEGGGPLHALFDASHSMKPRAHNPWEDDTISFLEAHSTTFTRHLLPATWSFASPDDFRKAMEVLPHIRGIRKRAGEEFYEELWRRTLSDHRCIQPDNSYGGTVNAALLIAEKP